MNLILGFFLYYFHSVLSLSNFQYYNTEFDDLSKCEICKSFTSNFQHGMDKTSKKNYDGGDADFEKNFVSYKDSELRLNEIIDEYACIDTKTVIRCRNFINEHEMSIEFWWKNKDTAEIKNKVLFDWLCIDKLNLCCPPFHYGPECLPCNGYPNEICNGNGYCNGNGTKDGTGQCNCFLGYQGINCSMCASNYYNSSKTEKLVCSKCYKSCSICTGPKLSECITCKQGMFMVNGICYDIDECATKKSRCKNSQYCVNLEGSYQCKKCHSACETCVDMGPANCKKCAAGYTKNKENVCEPIQTVDHIEQRTRYFTYLGLCIAVCIIVRKNFLTAAIFGVLIAMYIAASEYTIMYE